ncbi:MAG: tRNA (N(6)-L-threonylcarbamoyladenosine(37)-C(2))-methylthiotransferase MtaB [Hyphomicrobiales bacterium]|nr:tRNA (N(6)-L-threonylcarbamoyladenosine(37)-C(2))-methylthiotransferase MtaB [Hyphomicrobiales bacterium]
MNENRLITFGCRLNAYETQAMDEHARAAGLVGAVIVNTCAVTSEAVRQARQTIRRARREQPDAKIIVTGCAAQIDPGAFEAMPEVDHVIGNTEKMAAHTFRDLAGGVAERARVGDIMAVAKTAHHMIGGFGSRARAYVQVQNGCDHRCTFCIIPYGRGPSRSVPVAAVLMQTRELVERGYPEIVLTGVDITAYGTDLADGVTLGGLARLILRECPELRRLRFSSIDTIEADGELMRALAEEERLMPHLHLSMQSGDDMILKRMKRRHARADAVSFCAEARRLRPDISFGADLIAGFPTETDEMFANSERLIDDCGLTFCHIFPFSARPGTPAARMPQLDGALVKERAQRLRARAAEAVGRHLESFAGRSVELLMENAELGRARDFTEMTVDGACEQGTIVTARVTGHAVGKLTGALSA